MNTSMSLIDLQLSEQSTLFRVHLFQFLIKIIIKFKFLYITEKIEN